MVVRGWFGPERDRFGEYRWFDREADLTLDASEKWRTVTIVGRFCEFVTLGCVVRVSHASGAEVTSGVLEVRHHGWDRWVLRAPEPQPAGEVTVKFEALQHWRDISRRHVSLAVRAVSVQ